MDFGSFLLFFFLPLIIGNILGFNEWCCLLLGNIFDFFVGKDLIWIDFFGKWGLLNINLQKMNLKLLFE